MKRKKMEDNTTLKFNDDVIAEIAKLLQVALLTGTDVVDNLRMLEVTEEKSRLSLTQEYKTVSEQRMASMLEEIPVNDEAADVDKNDENSSQFLNNFEFTMVED
jgi:hypothetical protein